MEGKEPQTPESHATLAAKKQKESEKEGEGKSKGKQAQAPVEEGGQLVFDCPLYDIACSRERVFCGGGGGATRSGVPNQWAVLHWMPTSDQLKGET